MKKLIVSLAILGLCNGCITKTIYVHDEFPLLSVPEKPMMEDATLVNVPDETVDTIANNFNKMDKYSEQLKRTIEHYNLYAKEKNSRVDDK